MRVAQDTIRDRVSSLNNLNARKRTQQLTVFERLLEATTAVITMDTAAVKIVSQKHHMADPVLCSVDAHLATIHLLLGVVATATDSVRGAVHLRINGARVVSRRLRGGV